MLYDLAHFWVALLIAFALGCGCGWSTLTASPTRAAGGAPPLLAFLFVVGSALALLRMVPGQPGLMLETALLLSVAYVLGFGVVTATTKWRTSTTVRVQRTADVGFDQRPGADARGILARMTPRGSVLIAAAIASIAALLVATYVRRRRAPTAAGRRPSGVRRFGRAGGRASQPKRHDAPRASRRSPGCGR